MDPAIEARQANVTASAHTPLHRCHRRHRHHRNRRWAQPVAATVSVPTRACRNHPLRHTRQTPSVASLP